MITIGIDEVGRECWAGPLVAGAVILPSNLAWEVCPPNGIRTGVDELVLRDSKKMSKKQREIASAWLLANAVAVGIGWVWPSELDRVGITTGVKWAMERAFVELGDVVYEQIIIDGNINYFAKNPKARALIRADDTEPSVSAASIVAKVARDAYMASLPERYDGYGFASHVGYGTAAHSAALKLLGVSDIHRRSFKPIQALL